MVTFLCIVMSFRKLSFFIKNDKLDFSLSFSTEKVARILSKQLICSLLKQNLQLVI